jgi:hypothetical protein
VPEVEVCANSSDGTIEECGESNALGKYEIERLAAGTYSVYFYPYASTQDLVPQPYSGGSVTVTAGGQTTGINAALVTAGAIGGTVRLAATGAPLVGVRVCLTEASELFTLGCLKTPTSGGYRFTGLWSGSFKVVFSPEDSELVTPGFEEFESGFKPEAPDAYPTQWWNSKPTFGSADAIAVTPPGVVTGIDGSLGPPAAVTPPPPAVPIAAKVAKKKVLKCHRGFVKRKVKGKPRCVKPHKPSKHHRRHKKHRKPAR